MSAYFCTASLKLNSLYILLKYVQFLSASYLCYYFLLHSYLLLMNSTWFRTISISIVVNIVIATGLLTLTFYNTANASSKPPCKQLSWFILHILSIYPPLVLFTVSYRVTNKLTKLKHESRVIVQQRNNDLLW
jgi:hypothetical protein